MAGNRKAAENVILTLLKKLAPGGHTVKVTKEMFERMSDAEFDIFIQELDRGDRHLVVFSPNFGSEGLSTANNFKLADELGVKIFHKLHYEEDGESPEYQTPIEYMVMDVPVRRQSQTLDKKISVPEDNKTIDALTGQPTGDSKGARVSFPEIQFCAAMELDNTMVECLKVLGGDTKAMAAYNAMISQTGRANLNTIEQYAGGVESTHTLRTLLYCMHLANNL